MFRYKKSVPLSYERQGYIYFKSRCYQELPVTEQHRILNLCIETGGKHYQALFEYMTTDESATSVCIRHYLSRSTLERVVRKYYINFLSAEMQKEPEILRKDGRAHVPI